MRRMQLAPAIALAALALGSVPVHAQSSVQIWDYKTSSNACALSDANPAISSAACSANVTGGSASGSGAADRTARTASASGNMSQSGDVGSMTTLLESRGYVYSTVTLAGIIPMQSYLTYRFDVQESSKAQGLTGSAYAFDGLYLSGPSGAGQWRYLQKYANGGMIDYIDPNVTATATGLDYRAASPTTPGTYNYFYELAVEDYLNGPEGPGSKLSASISAKLVGIDLYDAGGTLLDSADFDASGAASLGVTATPEPASLSLVALGLGALGVTRRRRMR